MAERFLSHVKLRKGRLKGWHHTQETETRHRHLEEAAHEHGWGTVSRELNVLAIAEKNRDPAVSEVARRDQQWASRHEERRHERREMRE